MPYFQLYLYEPGKQNEFVRDVIVEMDVAEAATANRTARAKRIPLRWWPSPGPAPVEVESPRLRILHSLPARIVKVSLFCDNEADFHQALDQLGYSEDRYDGIFLRKTVLVDLDEFIAELTLLPASR